MTEVPITILLCANGTRHDIRVSPSTLLSKLKLLISLSPSISKSYGGTSIQSKHQRLFYFGRELTTSQRSLESLGLASPMKPRMPIIVHLHTTQPKVIQLGDDGGGGGVDDDGVMDSDNEIIEVDDGIMRPTQSYSRPSQIPFHPHTVVQQEQQSLTSSTTAVAPMISGYGRNPRFSTSHELLSTVNHNYNNSNNNPLHRKEDEAPKRNRDVVDLLDSDSDDNDDEIEFVETRNTLTSKKARIG